MKANIEVKTRDEADAIRTGLNDPVLRAVVTIVGILQPLSKRSRKRVLDFVMDRLEEENEARQVAVAEGNGQPSERP